MRKIPRQQRSIRHGSVYLAVLGTAMIVSVLALSSLALQRVQNRMLASSDNVRQAQHNAETSIELGLLTIKNEPSWRTSYANGSWFANRNLGTGTCSLTVTDPDGVLSDDPSDSVVMTGVGTSDSSEQRIVRTIDAYSQPLGCLYSSVAAGEALSVSNGAILRAANSGLITANSASVSSANVFGRVRAVTITGGNYTPAGTQIAAADRPAMPNWSTVFDYYRTSGTEIPVNSLLTSPPNLARNGTMASAPGGVLADWIGDPPGTNEDATVSQTGLVFNILGGSTSCQVQSRDTWYTGALQRIDAVVKPGQSYVVEGYVRFNFVVGQSTSSRNYGITCYTKGTGNGSALVDGGTSWPNQSASVPLMSWKKLSATITAQPWSGDLEYAYIKFAGSDTNNTGDFYLDDVTIREVGTGRYIYKQAIGPTANPYNSGTNADGVYWINCAGNKIVIERSRIRGTLLLVNPGAGTTVTGPINWSPAKPGFPALLIDADTAANADLSIALSNRALSESEDLVNYNPTGVSHPTFSTDTNELNDTYPSEIQGLIVVEDDVTFQNNSLVRGAVITGGDVTSTSGSLDVIYQPDSLYSPPPGFTGTWKAVTRPLSARKVVQ